MLFLTLQQCEKIWHMYSCVYRDLLSSAMRWEITVGSWKQIRKERSITSVLQHSFFTLCHLKVLESAFSVLPLKLVLTQDKIDHQSSTGKTSGHK